MKKQDAIGYMIREIKLLNGTIEEAQQKNMRDLETFYKGQRSAITALLCVIYDLTDNEIQVRIKQTVVID